MIKFSLRGDCGYISVETESQFVFVRKMPAQKRETNKEQLSLSELPAGGSGRVAALKGQVDFCQRLREMGFCESSVIQKIAGKEMLICQLCGTRVALSDRAARQIVIEPIRGDA